MITSFPPESGPVDLVRALGSFCRGQIVLAAGRVIVCFNGPYAGDMKIGLGIVNDIGDRLGFVIGDVEYAPVQGGFMMAEKAISS